MVVQDAQVKENREPFSPEGLLDASQNGKLPPPHTLFDLMLKKLEK